MGNGALKPAWRPSVPTLDWTIDNLRKYLGGRAFTLYSHGSCVVWVGDGELSVSEANDRLRAVTIRDPDFQVQRHADGNYLVTFKGGVGGLMPGDILNENLVQLRYEARSVGMLPSERLLTEEVDEDSELDMVAGLYVRARLYQDVEDLELVAVVR